MPTTNSGNTPEQIVANRQNVTYEKRFDKLRLNTLALYGGRPYIRERLTRFPGESTIDWAGSGVSYNQNRFSRSTIKVEGRRGRAYLVNHAGRIAEKVRQYVFAKPPQRPNVNVEMIADITRQGDSLNAFMGDVLKSIVATKWCWIGIDAPVVNGEISLADAKENKIRPYWRLYNAVDVVDWHIDDKGELQWLLTEGEKWDNSDPFVHNVVEPVRRLWQPGRVTEYTLKKQGSDGENKVTDVRVIPIDFAKVPFVPCGEICDKPHFYDDVEDIQKSILDLESSLDTLFFRTVFSQMVLPRSIADNPTGENDGQDLAQRVEAVVGLSNAILEGPDEKGIARYIGPDSAAIGKMQDELSRKREELFDVVGLHLNFTKNFSESADAKHFDHLDPQAVLRNYAQQVKEAEIRAWSLTAEWMSSVNVIEPVYSDKFRVSNIYEDFKSLVLAENMNLPDSVKKLSIHGVVDTILEITNMQLTDQQRRQIEDEIEKMEFDEPIALNAAAMRVDDGVRLQATDDGEGVRPSGAE